MFTSAASERAASARRCSRKEEEQLVRSLLMRLLITYQQLVLFWCRTQCGPLKLPIWSHLMCIQRAALLKHHPSTAANDCSISFQLAAITPSILPSSGSSSSLCLCPSGRRKQRRSRKISLMSFIHQIVTITQFIIVGG